MSEDSRERFEQLEAEFRQLERRHLKTLQIADKYQADYREVSEKLMETTAKLRELQEAMLPVCMHCKCVRVDEQTWSGLDRFLFEKADLLFTHGVCPTCLETRYGKLLDSTPPPSSARGDAVPQEDTTTRRFQALLDEAPRTAQPWRGWVEDLLRAYRRLLRRFVRVTQISDGYQHEVRESSLRLAHAVRTDQLTQFTTREAMIERLVVELDQRGAKDRRVVLVRMDGLRRVNQRAGIAVGDALILRTASRLASSVPGDVEWARWSAAEFLALVSDEASPASPDLESLIQGVLANVSVTYADKAWSLRPLVRAAPMRPGDNLDSLLERVRPAP